MAINLNKLKSKKSESKEKITTSDDLISANNTFYNIPSQPSIHTTRTRRGKPSAEPESEMPVGTVHAEPAIKVISSYDNTPKFMGHSDYYQTLGSDKSSTSSSVLIDKLGSLSASLDYKNKVKKEVKRKPAAIKNVYKSQYDFLLAHHFNKINNRTDYIEFLKKLQNINLNTLVECRDSEPNRTSGTIAFAQTEQNSITSNPYNILLLYLYRFGISIFNNGTTNETRIRNLVSYMAELLAPTTVQHEEYRELINSNITKLFTVPLYPYLYNGQTKEEFIIVMQYIEKNNFTLVDKTSIKSSKLITSINALDFVKHYHNFTVHLNFVTKEAVITYSEDSSLLLSKELFYFQNLINSFNYAEEEQIEQGNKKVFKDRININGKTYSSTLFEEMVETDIITFLSNLQFEEENYEEEILKKTI